MRIDNYTKHHQEMLEFFLEYLMSEREELRERAFCLMIEWGDELDEAEKTARARGFVWAAQHIDSIAADLEREFKHRDIQE